MSVAHPYRVIPQIPSQVIIRSFVATDKVNRSVSVAGSYRFNVSLSFSSRVIRRSLARIVLVTDP